MATPTPFLFLYLSRCITLCPSNYIMEQPSDYNQRTMMSQILQYYQIVFQVHIESLICIKIDVKASDIKPCTYLFTVNKFVICILITFYINIAIQVIVRVNFIFEITHTHTYIHTYTHTHIQTYTHTHTT